MWIFTRPWFIILDEFCLLLDIQTKKLLVVLSLATRIVTIILYYKKKYDYDDGGDVEVSGPASQQINHES